MNRRYLGINRRIAAIVITAYLGIALPAEAVDFKVYPYATPSQGEVETALWWTYTVRSNNTIDYFGNVLDEQGLNQYSLEIEYGMTDHWTIAGYADFQNPKDGDLKYVQARAVVARYRFFEQGERFLDGAIYVEYYLPYSKFSDSESLETRVILEKDIEYISIILNPIFDKGLSGSSTDEGLEFEYAAGLYYRATPRFTPGLEFYGSMGELSNLDPVKQQTHYIFPRLGIKFSRRASLDIGYGFGLTQASDDQILKAILEFEFL